MSTLDANASPRDQALAAATEVYVEPTALIGFQSSGKVLIIGPEEAALAAAARLGEPLHCWLLSDGAGSSREVNGHTLSFRNGRLIQAQGYLGNFQINLVEGDTSVDLAEALQVPGKCFDLLLDLSAEPLFTQELPPLGYYAPGSDSARLEAALTELPDMVGDFEKARFFHYNADICAHGNSQLQGCTRCLDVCPTGAITSLVEKIAVDPYYCQGGGSCATACPSGALIYSYPRPADTLNRLRVLLRRYREVGGEDPVLLIHDGTTGSQLLADLAEPLPGHVLPIEVEELGSVGLEIWLSALAYGARRVCLLRTPEIPASVIRELNTQLSYAHALLEGMGYPSGVLDYLPALTAETDWLDITMPDIRPAGFAGSNAKRDALFFALDWLAREAPITLPDVLALPQGAPLGEVQVNRDTCTLCMACVSVCPASALADGGDKPQLNFLEANCVQCGLCETACPEQAVSLHARLLMDREARRLHRVLNEEAAFHCVSCGKAFATRSMIDKMTEKLRSHHMFQSDAALQRLQMCGDCRVRAMFQDEGGLPR